MYRAPGEIHFEEVLDASLPGADGAIVEAALAAVHPMGRLAKPVEIASAARRLLSDEASFVTGTSYAVDGGHTAM